MVIGIDKFKEYFAGYEGNYIIIGGTACDLVLEEFPIVPRATKDIDIILVIEAMSVDFARQFWQFVVDGDYEQRQRNTADSGLKAEFYRFIKPKTKGFPKMLELFSRRPEILGETDFHLTPIPVEESISSLSAILLNDDYYDYTLINSRIEDGIHFADVSALICLKAKAYVELKVRMDNGDKVDRHDLLKHLVDIIKLMLTLSEEMTPYVLNETLREDMDLLIRLNEDSFPEQSVIDSLNLPKRTIINAWELLKKLFL